MLADRQTDTQTHRHTGHNTRLLLYRGGVTIQFENKLQCMPTINAWILYDAQLTQSNGQFKTFAFLLHQKYLCGLHQQVSANRAQRSGQIRVSQTDCCWQRIHDDSKPLLHIGQHCLRRTTTMRKLL